MPRYEVVPATQAHAEELAKTMRAWDRKECEAFGYGPLEALTVSIRHAWEALAGLADGRVFCIFGISAPSLLSRNAAPWLLASDELPRHSRAFLAANRQWIESLRARFATLSGHVHEDHLVSIRWLRWLGFSISDIAQPIGSNAQMFRRFSMDCRA